MGLDLQKEIWAEDMDLESLVEKASKIDYFCKTALAVVQLLMRLNTIAF